MAGPLDGIRVLEIGAIGPAPFAGALLADLGAELVRIDRPPVSNAPGELPSRFDFYNRNKRSVVLDLKDPAGVDLALQMAGRADIMLEGFRPGVMERLGLGPEICLEANTRLVYGRMTGWGQDGPLAQEAGHDINYLALTGALHCIGAPGQGPVPPLNLVADLGGGAMYLVVGVLAALHEARVSGQGQVVDAAMVDGVTHLMSAFQAFRQSGSWTANRGENLVDGGAPYYGTYETRDGKYVSVGAIEPHFYAALLDVLGMADQDLPSQNDRAAWPEMRRRLGEVFATRSRDEWVSAMAGREACFAPVLDIDEAPQHPHMRARAVHQRFDEVIHPSPAPRFSRTPASLRRPAPRPGEQTFEVLNDWDVKRRQNVGKTR